MLVFLKRLIREKEYGVMGHDDFWEALRKVSTLSFVVEDRHKTI